MTTRMARRSHFFDQTINELKIGYASRLNEKNNEESLLKKLTEDFSQLKVAIKLQDSNHQTTLHGLNQELIQQKETLQFRKYQSKQQKEKALHKLKQDIYNEIENEWKSKLKIVKEKGELRIQEEELKCRKKYDAVYDVLTNRYAAEYDHAVQKLEMQKRHHTQRQKTVTAEHILLQTREQRARESLNTMLKKADEKKKNDDLQLNVYNATRIRVEKLWDRYDVPIHERISFLLRVDELLPYGEEAARLYQEEIDHYNGKRRDI